MKTILFAILLACSATAAMGQAAAVLSNQPQLLVIPDHPGHAEHTPMAQEQNLWGNESPYTYAKGEVPLSDFAMTSEATPLGDVARSYRKEHISAKKATVVWAN